MTSRTVDLETGMLLERLQKSFSSSMLSASPWLQVNSGRKYFVKLQAAGSGSRYFQLGIKISVDFSCS